MFDFLGETHFIGMSLFIIAIYASLLYNKAKEVEERLGAIASMLYEITKNR